MRAHAITTQPGVAGRGRRKHRLVPGGILALSLAVVFLAATASTASALTTLKPWKCPPPSTPPTTLAEVQSCLGQFDGLGTFDFGDRQLGTTSPVQHFGLGVFENDTFNPEIRVTGNYAQTNNCPPTLSVTAPLPAIQGCLITVTFTPTGAGPKEGTLSTGPWGPTARLTGNGVTHPTPWPGLHLSGKKTQDQAIVPPRGGERWWMGCDRAYCDVQLKASCGDEACNARAVWKLTNVKKDFKPVREHLAPGRTAGLDLHLRLKGRQQALRAIDDGKNVLAKVTVRATFAAGKVATAKRTIKLVK